MAEHSEVEEDPPPAAQMSRPVTASFWQVVPDAQQIEDLADPQQVEPDGQHAPSTSRSSRALHAPLPPQQTSHLVVAGVTHMFMPGSKMLAPHVCPVPQHRKLPMTLPSAGLAAQQTSEPEQQLPSN
jgi:hypothetical protein